MRLSIKREIAILTLILFSGISFGQIEIRGKVVSELSKEVIWYGYTIKPNIDEHPTSYSDDEGNFIIKWLEPNKEYEIIISALGYEEQHFKVTTNDSIIYKTFELKGECIYSQEKAENDWNENSAQFLLFGSIAPIGNSKADNRFEKKYNIDYYDFGCVLSNYECIEIYNRKIAELMDEKFGKKWRKKARIDIIGI
ncbi:MAG: hypothetical protein PSN34_00185 [Urechidicola sp.]|nr:hypothetical protein [Urechidicola sp.]